MNGFSDIQTPILYCLTKRARCLKFTGNWEWVFRDPVVGCFATELYILGKEGKVSLSKNIRHDLAKQYWANIARWLVIENRLKHVLSLFRQSGVPVIPLKGAAFQGLLYKDVGLRSMSDIDLLVPSGSFLLASNILDQSGFRVYSKDSRGKIIWFDKKPKPYWPNELHFSDAQGLLIDLHQNLINAWFQPALLLEMESIWDRSNSVLSDGPSNEKYKDGLWKIFLSASDTLAYLCLHLALHHGLKVTQSYLDIDLWIQNLPADWDWNRFVELVNKWQIRSAAYHAFSYCQDFMGTPFPDGLLKLLDPGWLARFRVKMLISSQSILADRPSLGKRYPTLVKLALIDRLPSIMVTLIKLAFPSKTWHEHNPSGQGLLGHWLHVLQVVKRGD